MPCESSVQTSVQQPSSPIQRCDDIFAEVNMQCNSQSWDSVAPTQSTSTGSSTHDTGRVWSCKGTKPSTEGTVQQLQPSAGSAASSSLPIFPAEVPSVPNPITAGRPPSRPNLPMHLLQPEMHEIGTPPMPGNYMGDGNDRKPWFDQHMEDLFPHAQLPIPMNPNPHAPNQPSNIPPQVTPIRGCPAPPPNTGNQCRCQWQEGWFQEKGESREHVTECREQATGNLTWENFLQRPIGSGNAAIPSQLPFPVTPIHIDSVNLQPSPPVQQPFLQINTGDRYMEFMSSHQSSTMPGTQGGGDNDGGEWSMLNPAPCFGSSMPWQRERDSSLSRQTPFTQNMPWQSRSQDQSRWPPTLGACPQMCQPTVCQPCHLGLTPQHIPRPCYGGYFAADFNQHQCHGHGGGPPFDHFPPQGPGGGNPYGYPNCPPFGNPPGNQGYPGGPPFGPPFRPPGPPMPPAPQPCGACGRGQAAQKRWIPPPAWTPGGPTTLREWLWSLAGWRRITGMPVEEQGISTALSVGGRAAKIARSLDWSWLGSPVGLPYLIYHLEIGLGSEVQERQVHAIDQYRGISRGKQTSFVDHILNFELALTEAEKHGAVVDPIMKTHDLLRSANLSRDERQWVLQPVAGDLSQYPAIRAAMRRLPWHGAHLNRSGELYTGTIQHGDSAPSVNLHNNGQRLNQPPPEIYAAESSVQEDDSSDSSSESDDDFFDPDADFDDPETAQFVTAFAFHQKDKKHKIRFKPKKQKHDHKKFGDKHQGSKQPPKVKDPKRNLHQAPPKGVSQAEWRNGNHARGADHAGTEIAQSLEIPSTESTVAEKHILVLGVSLQL